MLHASCRLFRRPNARCLPETAKFITRAFQGNRQQMPVRARLGPSIPCSRVAGAPLKLGRRPLVSCRRPRTTCIDKWVARSRTASAVRRSPTIPSSRTAAPRCCPCLESQQTVPSVRALDRRGLVNLPCRRYQSFKSLPRLRRRNLWCHLGCLSLLK
jgi:hypothetical protein